MIVPLTAACLAAAAQTYVLPPVALYGILRVEGGREGLAKPNRNRTEDLGPFQVNTSWLKTFRDYWRQPDERTTYQLLRDNGCASAYAAAAILRYHVQNTGDLDAAIGRYHTGPAGLPAEAASYLQAYRHVVAFDRLPPKGDVRR